MSGFHFTLRDHMAKIDQDIDRITFALSLRTDEPLAAHAENLRELFGDLFCTYEARLASIPGGAHYEHAKGAAA